MASLAAFSAIGKAIKGAEVAQGAQKTEAMAKTGSEISALIDEGGVSITKTEDVITANRGVGEVLEEGVKKGTGKSIPKSSDLKNSQTVQNHMNDIIKKGANKGELSRPYIDTNGTNLLLDEIMGATSPVKDTVLNNGLRWDTPGVFRGSEGIWELVVDLDTNTIVHFNFTH